MSDRREFLYDVSSLANASGGDLIFGIKEANGVADEVTGLTSGNANDEILRLESIIQTGIEPRIPGISTRKIPIVGRGPVIIICVQLCLFSLG
jgi:predicted HTH transcriptional regulator